MASDTRLTLLDFYKARDPDGSQAQAVELMNQFNPILRDAPALPTNAPLGNRTTFTRSLPSVGTAKINRGVTRSKSTTDQRIDALGYFAGRSEIDSRIRKMVGADAFNRRRMDEDNRFEEAFAQYVAQVSFYGNLASDEASFDGLGTRMGTLNPGTDLTASQVWSMGTVTGGDGTSLYIVDWGERTCFLGYPQNAAGGLDVEDKGEQNVNDVDGNPMFAYVSVYDWFCGLVVKDPRRIARLANIDLSDALAGGATQGILIDKLEQIMARMPTPPRGDEVVGRRVLYCATALWAAFTKQARSQSNQALSIQDYLGQPTPHFWGHPVVQCDQVSTTEPTVS